MPPFTRSEPGLLFLVYLRPRGDFRGYEARVRELAAGAGSRLRFVAGGSRDLVRLTSERVFLGEPLPTVLLVTSGKVVAQGIGALPTSELRLLLRHALSSLPQRRPPRKRSVRGFHPAATAGDVAPG